MKYPTRCQIIDVTDAEVFPGIKGRTPDASRPYVGEFGVAELIDGAVRITLDGGGVLMGYECWWTTVEEISA